MKATTSCEIPEHIKAIQWTGKNFEETKEIFNDKVFLKNDTLFAKIPSGNIYKLEVGNFLTLGQKGEAIPMTNEVFSVYASLKTQ
jgi:hypothetical protein